MQYNQASFISFCPSHAAAPVTNANATALMACLVISASRMPTRKPNAVDINALFIKKGFSIIWLIKKSCLSFH